MTEPDLYDVAIVGAGPGGCACALSLEGSGLRVVLLDKASFPRDKVCGDALSPDVLNQLSMLNGDLARDFESTIPERKTVVSGVRIVSANGRMAELSLTDSMTGISGWVSKRADFDNFLFQHARDLPFVTVMEDSKVEGIEMTSQHVELLTSRGKLRSKVAIGADGAHSVIAKSMGRFKMDRDHYCGAVRAYYRNVSGFHSDGLIELHFYKRLLPGYFWIFPLPNGEANVGLGMLSSFISRKKVNLRALFEKVIASEPGLSERFANAEMIGKLEGFGLPLGSKKRRLSGERFMLIGDAASMIDPITGEGIGNAIRSGRYAAEQIRKCFEEGDFSEDFMRYYDKYLYSKVWGEMRFSRTLQIAFRYPILVNALTGVAARSQRFRQFLNLAISDAGFWGDGLNPARWRRHWKGAKSMERDNC